jgi:hypothetical protein
MISAIVVGAVGLFMGVFSKTKVTDPHIRTFAPERCYFRFGRGGCVRMCGSTDKNRANGSSKSAHR